MKAFHHAQGLAVMAPGSEIERVLCKYSLNGREVNWGLSPLTKVMIG